MTYTPINWQTGDTITAEKLNRCDNGWLVTSGSTTLCDDTVTTEDDDGNNVAYLNISDGATITAETIIVTFDGTEYTCTKHGDTYGGTDFDFSVYPFMLYDDGTLCTETAGTYSVKIEVEETSIETSAQFAAVVASAAASAVPIMQIVESRTTWQEVYDALSHGAIVFYTVQYLEECTFYLATSVYESSGVFYVTTATVYQSGTSVNIHRLTAPSASGTLEPVF